jgi:hypothetical protein
MPKYSKALRFVAKKASDWGDDCYALPDPQDYIFFDKAGRKPGWVACRFAHGAPEKGQVALNECGIGDCVNGSHWRWGTWEEAMARREFPSRKGGKNPNAKLTEADVAAIRAIDFGGHNNRKPVADKYGISLATLHAIIKGWTWKGVEAAKPAPENEGGEF